MPQLITATLTPQEFHNLFGFIEPSNLAQIRETVPIKGLDKKIIGHTQQPKFRLVINKFGRCYWLLTVDNLQGPRFSGINVYYQGNNSRLIRTIHPNARRIIDVGANIGNNTIAYAEWAENVESFEPTPTTLQMLEANVEIAKRSTLHGIYWKGNSRQGSLSRDPNQTVGWYVYKGTPQPMNIKGNITIHKVALTNTANVGTIGIQDHPEHGGHNYAVYDQSQVKKSKPVVQVPARTIDSYNFEDVDAIKIDVEGSELFVIQGAESTINNYRPVVQTEIVPKQCKKYGYEPQEIYDFFKKRDYVCVSAVRKPANKIQKDMGLYFGKELRMEHEQIPKYMDRLFVPKELHDNTDYKVIDQYSSAYDNILDKSDLKAA